MKKRVAGNRPRKRPKKYAYRTTLSLDAEAAALLREFARAEKLAEPEAARVVLQRWLTKHRPGPNARGATASQLRNLMSLAERLPNPYQELLAEWRLARTERQLTAISAFHLELEAWPAERYLMNILRELLHKMGPNDEFLAVTTLDFWTEGDAGRADSVALYLAAQREAIRRGMRLFRVFLVPSTERDPGRGLERHRRFLQELSDIKPSIVRVCCRAVEDPAAAGGFGHFACVRRVDSSAKPFSPLSRDSGCLVVEPTYQDSTIGKLKFLLSRGASSDDDLELKLYVDRFFQVANDPATKPLD